MLKMLPKKPVTRETAVRYRHACKAVKRRMPGEFVELTGNKRKSAGKTPGAAAKTCLAEVYGRNVIRKAEREKRPKREYAKCYDGPVQVMPGRFRRGKKDFLRSKNDFGQSRWLSTYSKGL